MVSRCLLSGTLEALPEPPAGKRRGRPPRTGQAAGLPPHVGPQAPRLAAASHGSQGGGPSRDRPVAYRPAGAAGTRSRGPSPRRPVQTARPAPTASPSRSLLHHGSLAQPGGHPAAVSRPRGRRNRQSRPQGLQRPGPGPVPEDPAPGRGHHVSPRDGRHADALVSRPGSPASRDESPALSTLVPAEMRPQPTRQYLGRSRRLARGGRFPPTTGYPRSYRKSCGAGPCATFSRIRRETND